MSTQSLTTNSAYTARHESEELTTLLGRKDPALPRLVERKDEELTKLLMRGESAIAKVSKQRRARKQQGETDQQPKPTLNHGRGHGHSGGGKFPEHPLLKKAGQKYDGREDSPIAANDPELSDTLFEHIADVVQDAPTQELKQELTNKLQNSLEARIALYNQQRLQNSHTNIPRLEAK